MADAVLSDLEHEMRRSTRQRLVCKRGQQPGVSGAVASAVPIGRITRCAESQMAGGCNGEARQPQDRVVRASAIYLRSKRQAGCRRIVDELESASRAGSRRVVHRDCPGWGRIEI